MRTEFKIKILSCLIVACIIGIGAVSAEGVTAKFAGNLETTQWASSAEASSEWSEYSWSAMEAANSPDTSSCGDHSTAWAPQPSGSEPQWLEASFNTPVYAEEIVIHETYNSGFVYRIDLIDEEGNYHKVWSGTDNTDCPGWFNLSLQTSYKVEGVKIYTQKQGWEEIDAVGLVSSTSTPTSTPTATPTPSSPSPVEIHAFDQNPAGSDVGKEWVTLYNPSDSSIDVGGWKLKTTHGSTVTAEIPHGTILESEGYWTYIHEDQWLDNSMESIKLVNEDGDLVDQTSTLSDSEGDNQYWYKDTGWQFGLKDLQSGVSRSGEVINVVDGDTVDISPVGIAGVQRVRLACIDTPEKYAEGYEEAKDYVETMCSDKKVEFDVDDVTQYGDYNRVLAVVKVDGTNLNKELLNEGYAEVWEHYTSSESEFNPYNWLDTTENICKWIEGIGVHNLTHNHARYLYYLYAGDLNQAEEYYGQLKPQPQRFDSDAASWELYLGVYQYTWGDFESGDSYTGCDFTTVTDICSWVQSKGGPTAITSSDLESLTKAYVGEKTLNFEVTSDHIAGCTLYYYDDINAGNDLIGCSFT